MGALSIRNLPDGVRARLRVRAAKRGRSMEAEARAILTAACLEEEPSVPAAELQDWVDSLYGDARPANVVDELLAERRAEAAREAAE